jgi:acyl-CoA synthetase (AMP-forming)/AMP-acid ligase II
MATAVPFNHQAAHVVMTLGLFDKVRMWSLDRFEPRAALELIQRERIHCFIGFSDTYLRMYEEGLDAYDLSSVRFWLNSADAAHDVHMQAFTRRGVCLGLFGRPLLRSIFLDGVGASEVGTSAVARAVFSFTRPTFRRRVGRTWPFGPQVKIADEHGEPLPPGQVGGFMVRGRTVFKGYWNAHERLHGNLQGGWWRTGDVGYRDRLGRYYHLDRAVDVIHTPAGPVYSLLFEELLLSHPDVSEVAVIGVPGPGEGQVPVAVLYARRGHTLDAEAVLAWTNERSRQVRGLEQVIVVEREGIPRGLTGKVLKRVLRERYAHRLQDEAVAPRVSAGAR